MKLLLDECTPARLKRDFTGHQAFTVDDVGLKGVKNGALLRAATGQFDVLISFASKVRKSHPRQWVDSFSSPTYQAFATELVESHQRQLVDISDPASVQLMRISLAKK